MKKLFFYLLKKYSRTESGRLEIHEFLNEQVESTYHEQNKYGNVYNSSIEFIMGNQFITKLVKENDDVGLKSIESLIIKSIPAAFQFIKNENIKGKRREKMKKILKNKTN